MGQGNVRWWLGGQVKFMWGSNLKSILSLTFVNVKHQICIFSIKENDTDTSNINIPEFEYYELVNWIIREFLLYAVLFSQFFSWFCGSIAFTLTHHRWWNLLMGIMFGICIPVDVLIFYAEPFGVFGTLATTILAFAPFLSMVADSCFPVKKIWVKGRCKNLSKVVH